MRRVYIIILCHLYPAYIVLHMMFGNWSRLSQVVFNIVPIAVFGSLFKIWATTSHIKLDKIEALSIKYLSFMISIIFFYYILCIFSSPYWIYNHNIQASIFVSATLLFYIYAMYEQ